MSDHLPECPLGQPCQSSEPDHVMQGTIAGIPVTVCGLCMADCICDRLRACEQRVRLEDDDYAYVAAQAEADGRRRGWNEALETARERIMRLPYEIDDEILIDRDEVIGWIDGLRQEP